MEKIPKDEINNLLHEGAKNVLKLMIPTTICMILVVMIVTFLPVFLQEPNQQLIYTPLKEKAYNSTAEKFGIGIVNTIIFLSMVIFMTFLLVCLFYLEYYNCLMYLLGFGLALMFGFLTHTLLHVVFEQYNIPCDIITSLIICYNFTCVAILSIHWKSPKKLQQSVLILLTSQAALLFVKFMPYYTAWIVLAGLVIWDLIAVLCPKGPLNLLVKMATEREKPLASALIYSTSIFMADKARNQKIIRDIDNYSRNSREQNNSRGPKLGLGDFVFYSVLVGISMKCKSFFVFYACLVSIQIGLMTTLFFLSVFKRALPALPISLTFGIVMFMFVCNITEEMSFCFSSSQVFI